MVCPSRKKVGPHPELVEEFLALTGQKFHIYELLQFLRYAAETGSVIQEAAVQQIADTLLADSAAASTQTATAERSRVIKTLRAELKSKESELDSLIKSLIDFPPKTGDAPGDDAKRILKTRISELTNLVNTMRDRLNDLESDQDTGG